MREVANVGEEFAMNGDYLPRQCELRERATADAGLRCTDRRQLQGSDRRELREYCGAG
jgi:hypothetical protein